MRDRPMSRTLPIALLAVLGLSACAGGAHRTAAPRPSPPGPIVPMPVLPADPGLAMEACRSIDIETEHLDYTVSNPVPTYELRTIVAEAPSGDDELARGMQHRHDPDPRQAMIFEFDGDHNPAMWMKDTPASLDMVFISGAGDAIYLELGTEPFSEMFLTPEEPEPVARWVLELPAGGAARLGITPGMTRFAIAEPRACASWMALF